jgi:transposase
MSHKQSKKTRLPAQLTEMIAVSVPELEAIVAAGRTRPLTEEEAQTQRATFHTIERIKQIWQSQCGSLKRLLKMLFGPRTEKTQAVLGKPKAQGEAVTGGGATAGEAADASDEEDTSEADTAPVKRKGHGRNGVAALTGALRVPVEHRALARGEGCPECTGKVYPLKVPKRLVRIVGMAPLMATVYECERLRCNACGEVFSAPAPQGIGDKKYDETATAAVGMLRYNVGLPLNQVEKLQEGYGLPCPVSTQWDLLEDGGAKLEPGFEELIRQGAQGDIQHNDDTGMRILGLTREERAQALGEDANEQRTGVFTTGIVSIGEAVKIALFFTGVHYAGENLSKVLKQRAAQLPPPIHMCDGLYSRNRPKGFETLMASCNVHGRRKFVEIAEIFPEETRFVLETLREVYKTDAKAKQEKLTSQQRLALHQRESGPQMAALKAWMQEQIDDRKVEPNSALGRAIRYMNRRWSRLTLFLRLENVPLDNNICERILKKAIRHRRNSLYYRTTNGARIGDIWMSLIHTAELNGVPAFEYLVALLRHANELAASPAEWMPWTFRATLERLKQEAERSCLSPDGPVPTPVPQLTRGASGSSGSGRHIGAAPAPAGSAPPINA